MSTYYPKAGDVAEKWYLVDARGETVGRLASRVAGILRGKHEPTFHPSVDAQAHVVVINAEKAIFTGRKAQQKNYFWHTQYPGGLRSRSAETLMRDKPGDVVRRAIEGMLPKTKLGERYKTHLRVFAGDQHPHEAQQPVVLENLVKRHDNK
jgi:large subunit ribosomal protein L13